jgi:hypothetical protein
MSPASAPVSTLPLTLVTAPGCHFCEDAGQVLATLIADGAAITLDVVEATSAPGLALLAEHRPPMNPLVLADGRYFSAGRLPRRKLQALLDRRSADPLVGVSPRG